uniref:Sulfatase N-terminal domain-containing protein n=1 Tax=Capitella teleta TaxID=283909 RepID=X2B4R5_CAPTE
MNVVMFMIDGFRSELGSYLDTRSEQPWLFDGTRTPNLHRLASVSMRFKRAFAQMSICAPSRSSIMVSRRPDALHVTSMMTGFRETAGENTITLPQYFRQHGYTTIGLGKAFCP